ncbi:MAG: nicotinate-nucleotide adenylyltransferase [Verrucomicrobiota bacterium]
MRIGIYGGSFDPIHHGHLLLAQDTCELAGLDHLYFIPAAQAPLKKSGPPGATAEQRVAMIQMAIESNPSFGLLTDEIDRGGVSYTIDTLRLLHDRWPQDELFWLLGADQIAQLDDWRAIGEIAEIVTFLCLKRPGYGFEPPRLVPAERMIEVSARQMELSSSEIRERATDNRPLDFFLPPRLISYIKDNRLYR